jgi:hypothetical protein
MLHEFFGNADAGIRNAEFNGSCFICKRKFPDGKGNAAAFPVVLDRISQDVDEDLADMERAAGQTAVDDARCIQIKRQLSSCGHFRANDRTAVIQQRLQVEGLCGKFHLPAFQPADVEDVVDEGKKMHGRDADFLQAVRLARRIGRIPFRDVQHPDDAVDRRTDIMAHMRKKFRLCLICRIGGIRGRSPAAGSGR